MPRTIEGTLHGDGLKFAVIASRFHDEIVEALLQGTLECLERHGVRSHAVEVYRVPGAFEIPSLAEELARRGAHNALITIGVLVRGDTPHFDFIATQVTNAVSRVSVENHLPVSFGVITCNTIEQARERTRKGNNKGWEAALAAIEMANLYRRLDDSTTRRQDGLKKRRSSGPAVRPSGRRKGGR